MMNLALQSIYGFFWLFTGLNGFFRWLPIPFVANEIEEVNQTFVKTKFLMTTVKIIEMAAGLMLMLNFMPLLGLLMLAPLIFGICGLHTRYNPKPYFMLGGLLLPYLLLLTFYRDSLLQILQTQL